MLHLSDNIKIVRKLLGQTQEEFIKHFTGVTVAMQKSYEGQKAEPGVMYMQELSHLAGVTIDKLTKGQLTKNDLKKVEKVDKVSEPEPNYETQKEEVVSVQTIFNLSETAKNHSEADLINARNIERLLNLLENKLLGIKGLELPPKGTPGTRTLTEKDKVEEKNQS